MAIHSRHYNNDNEQRAYPISDVATLAAVGGVEVPSDILIELSIAIPSTVGSAVFVKQMHRGFGVSSVIFSAIEAPYPYGETDTPFAPGEGIEVGYAVITSEDDLYRVLPIRSIVTGVYGWVVFGQGAVDKNLELGVWNFLSPAASIVCDKCVSVLPTTQIPGIGVGTSKDKLVGDVQIGTTSKALSFARQDIQILDGESLIDVSAIVVSMQKTKETLLSFVSSCEKAPSEGECENGVAIETISGAVPDCGVITIRFDGCVIIHPLSLVDTCGVILECETTVDELCNDEQIPEGGIEFTEDECNPTPSAWFGDKSNDQEKEARLFGAMTETLDVHVIDDYSMAAFDFSKINNPEIEARWSANIGDLTGLVGIAIGIGGDKVPHSFWFVGAVGPPALSCCGLFRDGVLESPTMYDMTGVDRVLVRYSRSHGRMEMNFYNGEYTINIVAPVNLPASASINGLFVKKSAVSFLEVSLRGN